MNTETVTSPKSSSTMSKGDRAKLIAKQAEKKAPRAKRDTAPAITPKEVEKAVHAAVERVEDAIVIMPRARRNTTPPPAPVGEDGLSIPQVCKELGVDPKVGRAKLRRLGYKAVNGRWSKVAPGSKELAELVAILKRPTAVTE